MSQTTTIYNPVVPVHVHPTEFQQLAEQELAKYQYHKQATTIFFPCFTVHFNTPPLPAHMTPKVETMSLNNTLTPFFTPPTHLS